jgi:hypothetical protein
VFGLRRHLGRGVEVSDLDANGRVVEPDGVFAHEALAPEVARAALDLDQTSSLGEHEVMLQARDLAIAEPLAQRAVGSLDGDMISTMIVGSATTGVDKSMGAQVTTTSGIAEISSVRI